MDSKKGDKQIEMGSEASSEKFDDAANFILDPAQPQIRKSRWSGPEAIKSLDKTIELLVVAYLVANLNFTNIPLKQFLDDFEKKILLKCLRLTHGNQKNAADLLGLKPTALFEKMRKHGINGRRIKFSEKVEALPPQEIE